MSLAYDNLFRLGSNAALAMQQRQQEAAEGGILTPPPVAEERDEVAQTQNGVIADAGDVEADEGDAMMMDEPSYQLDSDGSDGEGMALDAYEYNYEVEQDDESMEDEEAPAIPDQIVGNDGQPMYFEEPLSSDDDSSDDGVADYLQDYQDDWEDEVPSDEESDNSSIDELDQEAQLQINGLPVPENAGPSIRRLLALSDYLRDLVRNRSAPVCRRERYRQIMIVLLPNLTTLDRRPITEEERAEAIVEIEKIMCLPEFPKRSTFSNVFLRECNYWNLPSRQANVCQLDVEKRIFCSTYAPSKRIVLPQLRPRQIEYHPSIPGRLLMGTISSAEVAVCNPYSGEYGSIIARCPATGGSTVLGMSWLKQGSLLFPSALFV
jgi:hypothetical protein